MFCKKCGNQLNPNDKFCMKCGAPNEEKSEVKSNMADSNVSQTQNTNPQQNLNFNPNQNPNQNPNMNSNSNQNPNMNSNMNFNPNFNQNQNYTQNYNPNPNFNQGGWGMMPYPNAPAVKKSGGVVPKIVILIMTAIAAFCIYGMFFFPIYEYSDLRISMSIYNIQEAFEYYIDYLEEGIADIILWSAVGITAILAILLLIAIINCIFSKHKSAYILLFVSFIIITIVLIGLVVCAFVMKEYAYYDYTVSPMIICVAVLSLVSTILTPILRAKCS